MNTWRNRPLKPTPKIISTQAYIEHGQITITSDSELNNSVVTGFKGNGTIDDPILIEGLNITDSSGTLLYIRDTTFYFRIQNNLLDGLTTANHGVYLENVINGFVFNNIVYNTTWSGFELQSSSNNSVTYNKVFNITNGAGISLYSSKNNTISHNEAYNNDGDGIMLHTANHNNTISHNTAFNNNWQGIRLEDTNENCTILNNTVYNNKEDGIRLITSSNNILQNNTAFDGYGNGILIIDDSNNNLILNNHLYNNEYDGISIGGTPRSHNNCVFNNTIYDNSGTGIGLDGNNNRLFNNLIYNNAAGISAWNSNYTIISTNTVHHHTNSGIGVDSSNHSLIMNNLISFSGENGIGTGHSTNNTISNNTVFNNAGWGQINAGYSTNIRILNNTIYNGWNGISLENSSYCDVTDNTVYSNGLNGILAYKIAIDNNILNNTVFDNVGGIRVWDVRIHLGMISYNLIYDNEEHGISIAGNDYIIEANDLSGNNAGRVQAYDEGSDNIFEGNYWSDWTGTGGYSIEGSPANQDPSPLADPYHLSVPSIIKPTTDNLTLSGLVLIQWSASTDTFGHPIIYSVLYSTTDGGSWTTLASGLISTNYTCDTLLIGDGPILFKVQATDSIGFTSLSISEDTFLIANQHLSFPTLLSPNGGETLTGTVTIEWSASIDVYNHSVTYTIYYSSDEGATWSELASGLTVTSYSWDITEVSNGLSYLVKVVATCSEGAIAEDVSDDTFAVHNEIATSTTTPTTSSEIAPGLNVISLIWILGTVIVVRRNRKN